MKKYISFICSVLLLGTMSCIDTRYDEIINDTAYFPKSDLQEETLSVMNAEDYIYNIWIHKAGYFQEKFVGKVELDYNFLMEYNVDNGTNYEMLDESYFSFERNFTIEEGIDEVAVPLTLKIENIINDKGYKTVYIPFSVTSLTPGSGVNVDKSRFILALSLQQPQLKIDGENFGEMKVDFNEVTGNYELDITSVLDVKTTEELEVTYTVDPELLPEGENLLQKGYNMNQNVMIPVGEQYAENYLTINPDEITNGRWVLPIRMSSTNQKIEVVKNASTLLLTVVKGNIDSEIALSGDMVQINEIILAADNTNSVEIGGVIDGLDFTQYEVEVKDSEWLTASYNDVTGKISVQATSSNNLSNKENTAILLIRSKATLLEKEITVRQCIPGYGVILNKSLWSAELINSSDVSVGGNVPKIEGLFDNSWSTSDSNKLFVEFNSKTQQVELVFDLGENPHQYSHLGLLPRIEWVAQSPKKVKIDYSDDKSSWTEGEKQEGFTEQELKGGGSNWLTSQYDCKLIKWFPIMNDGRVVTSRYLRVTVYGSYWNNGSYISFDEFFIADRTGVQE